MFYWASSEDYEGSSLRYSVINVHTHLTLGVTHVHSEADGVQRDKQTGAEDREVARAAHSLPCAGLGQGNHPVRLPHVPQFTKVLTEHREHAHLHTDPNRPIRSAARRHVDEVILRGVVQATKTRQSDYGKRRILVLGLCLGHK